MWEVFYISQIIPFKIVLSPRKVLISLYLSLSQSLLESKSFTGTKLSWTAVDLCDFYASATKHLGIGLLVGWSVGWSRHKFQKSYHTHARRRETLYDVARLLLMVSLEPWQNYTPFFCAAAFCTTKIDDLKMKTTLKMKMTSEIKTTSKIMMTSKWRRPKKWRQPHFEGYSWPE